MPSNRQYHQSLETKHNVIALDPVELLAFANNPTVHPERLRSHLLNSAVLAKWARESTDTIPDPVFKIIETELLGRAERAEYKKN